LTAAVIVLFQAAMVDVLTEDQKRKILTESGEIYPMGRKPPEYSKRSESALLSSAIVGRGPYDARHFGTALPSAWRIKKDTDFRIANRNLEYNGAVEKNPAMVFSKYLPDIRCPRLGAP
jgi:hypothetical protein